MLARVKNFLNYTWEDDGRDRRLESYIISSQKYLSSIAGVEIDFEEDDLAMDLLLNRVFYMDSQALDDFNRNYNDMLNELRIKYVEVEAE